jgi:hypothetical protein
MPSPVDKGPSVRARPLSPKVGHSRLVPPIPKAAVRDAKIKSFASAAGQHEVVADIRGPR